MLLLASFALGLLIGALALVWPLRRANQTLVSRLESRFRAEEEEAELERRRDTYESERDEMVRPSAGQPVRLSSMGVMVPGALSAYNLQNSRLRGPAE